MPPANALPEDTRRELEAIGQADILVGIPSFNNASTIGHVAASSARGMAEHFPGLKAVLINSDGGSKDETSGAFMRAEAPSGTTKLSFSYEGPAGKGSSLKAIFEACSLLRVKAGVVVDADLRSITPLWVKLLADPVVRGEAEYVTPYYIRHKYDGTITNNIVYPTTRALYGVRIRQPIGGDFAFSGGLARVYTEKDVWETDVARFGIDVFMTTTAIMEGAPICQASLGTKIHDPRDPAASLGPMFRQVTGTIFRLMRQYQERWKDISGSKLAPVMGPASDAEPEPVNANLSALLEKFRSGCRASAPRLEEFLSTGNFEELKEHAEAEGEKCELSPRLWARIVYDFAIEYNRGRHDPDEVVDAMTPIYFGRVASFVSQTADLSTTQAEKIIEEQAEVFEQEKSYLLSRWENIIQGA
jgi:hypothetical protein